MFQVSGVPVGEMRGFSLTQRPFPVIAVNSRDAVTARIFTLFHELGHILIGDGGLCDLEGEVSARDAQLKERFCNALAAEVLVPEDALRAMPEWQSRPAPESWTLAAVAAFSKRFWVSDAVMLHRVSDLGAISELSAREFWRDLSQRQLPATNGMVPQHTKVVAVAGRTYTRLVLDAFHRDAITLRDVSDYLDVKVRHIPKIEDVIYGAAPTDQEEG